LFCPPNLAITPELVVDTIRLIGSNTQGSNTSTVFFEGGRFNSSDPAFLSRRGARAAMDTLMMILFGSVLSAMTALGFIELRRIRKKLESKEANAKSPGHA
jgi:hypothetical protein